MHRSARALAPPDDRFTPQAGRGMAEAAAPQEGLRDALTAWTELLGRDAVLDSRQAQERYGPAGQGTLQRPIAAALRPVRVEQIAPIVRIAARHGVPLYPVSTGKNWGYGGASPAADHCVVLDLARLDNIVEVDAELGTVTLEPGVTQGQLREYLDRHGLPFMVPTTGAGPGASLLGNALERGYGLTPHADHFGAVTSLEAVLPDGSTYRSSLADWGGQRVDKGHKWGIGPYLDGLFAQGNFGVVTRMTIALAPRPPHVEVFLACIDHERDVPAAVAEVRSLLQSIGGVMGNVNFLNGYRLAAMSCPYPFDEVPPGSAMSAEQLQRLLRAHGLPPWMLIGAVYGEPGTAKAAIQAIRRRLRPYARRRVALTRPRLARLQRLLHWLPRRLACRLGWAQLDRMASLMNLLEGKPDPVALRLVHWKCREGPPADLDAGVLQRGLTWYAPLVPMAPAAVSAYCRMVETICRAHGFEPMITLTSLSPRCFDSSVPLLFDPQVPGEAARARACYEALFAAGRRLGFLPYRIGADAAHLLASAEGGGFSLARRVKASLDPRGIIAPGRYGL
jgi:4-cresol dehydrogenase (hydroxylating) flavoprotein subunit